MPTPAERLKRYRLLADEIRTASEDMRNADARIALIRIADSYDLLAGDIEMREKRTRQTPTGTG
jgi:hypothetical protein